MRAFAPRTAAALAAVTLLACGGGGGDAPIAVTITPSSISKSYAQGAPNLSQTVDVTLSQALSGTVYLYVVQDQPVLTPQVDLTITSNTSFHATLRPDCMLAPGAHSGNLTLRLCKDEACGGEFPLSGNVLPYAFTVVPGVVITVKRNGVAAPGTFASCTATRPPNVAPGQVLELTSSLPVTWTYAIGASAGVPVVSGLATTATTWSATITDQSGRNTPGAYYGVVSVSATPEGGGPPTSFSFSLVGG